MTKAGLRLPLIIRAGKRKKTVLRSRVKKSTLDELEKEFDFINSTIVYIIIVFKDFPFYQKNVIVLKYACYVRYEIETVFYSHIQISVCQRRNEIYRETFPQKPTSFGRHNFQVFANCIFYGRNLSCQIVIFVSLLFIFIY